MNPNLDALLDDFIKVATISGINIPRNSLTLQIMNAPHKPPSSLPAGKMAVYIFMWKDRCLKVGKVGPNSQARYTSQHYLPKSSRSNLTKSVLSSQIELGISGISDLTVGHWIKDNVDRANILVDKKYGIAMLTLLESFFQCRLKPRFEGYESQNEIIG